MQIVVAERNQLQGPQGKCIAQSVKAVMATLENQIQALTEQIEHLLKEDLNLQKKHEILRNIPGIGSITAFQLLTLLPELGTCNRRQITSLVELAPQARR